MRIIFILAPWIAGGCLFLGAVGTNIPRTIGAAILVLCTCAIVAAPDIARLWARYRKK